MEPLFSECREFKEDRSYAGYKRSLGADGHDLDVFLEDSESSVPSSQVEEVQEFCQGVRLEDLTSGVGTAGQRRAAWLDDRSFLNRTNDQCVRKYDNPLTATALYRLLKVAVSGQS
jgi:hypothetical protein